MGKSQDRKMDELKRGKICMDCLAVGIEIEWPSECLDFDHRDGDQKSGSIRSFLHHPELLLTEIAKCDVVCSNHHRIRTRQRGVSEKTKKAIQAARNKPGDKERDSNIQRESWKRNHDARAKAVRDAQRRPETREKMKSSTADSWLNPEIKAKRQEGMRKAWVTRKNQSK